MTSNSTASMRVLITYAICIPLAVYVGYLMTEVGNAPSYSNLFVVGLVVALIVSPVFIKWHYPIMVFGLGCPMYVFFLKGDPPLWQIVVLMSLGIAIVERTLNQNRRFFSVPSVTWPLLFTAAMAIATAQLTGGIGLHQLGGATGGGKKYLALGMGILMYFALTSRPIPRNHFKFYIVLLFLSGLPAFISDLFPLLPYPFYYINLLFPPSGNSTDDPWSFGITRLGAFATTAGTIIGFMLARYGLRGIFMGGKLWRAPFFLAMLALTFLGGYRITVITYIMLFGLLFFLEGLHRTRAVPVFLLCGLVGVSLLVPFANKLPFTYQRALSFLPLKVDAEGSLDWRLRLWRDTWPQVPHYLLLGKGYLLNAQDYQMIGNGTFANGIGANMDASQESLALSGDYHSGPLSVLMPFGIWGAIAFLWLTLAGMRVMYRNFKYGDPELKVVNTLLFAMYLQHFIGFFALIGSYSDDVGFFAKLAGFSIALNWGVRGPQPRPITVQRFRPLPQAQPQPA